MKSIIIRKYSDTTGLADCRPDLWAWLGLTEADARGRSDEWYRVPLVSDMPHAIWSCTDSGKRTYAKTLAELIVKTGLTHA